MASPPSVLLVEPFYGGSHKQLIDLLQENVSGVSVCTLPAKKWPWRARTAALLFSQTIPCCSSYRVLFCSSVLNLCELVALRPDLARLKKVLYFHENQLVYPVRKDQQRDFQYGYNQILSCLVSDVVVFNSSYNMDSFLSSISSFMKKIPDHRPRDLDQLIRPKCVVLHFPLQLPDISRMLPKHKLLRRKPHADDIITPQDQLLSPRCEEISEQEDPHESRPEPGPEDQQDPKDQKKPLHIVWPHRWEHDKNPELLFSTLIKLKERRVNFHLSVLGETYTDVPERTSCGCCVTPTWSSPPPDTSSSESPCWRRFTVAAILCVPRLWSIPKYSQQSTCTPHLSSCVNGCSNSAGGPTSPADTLSRWTCPASPGRL
ncbi:tRNA-queuosine alpha-mannosyltransferase isoform X4 [Perca flavescens]|uniref:tRNA-queuosine alpha-mannosyltransferase isoform X4 n=1 Tax=Perca flavescens TaxID=8167 RepID=UPI00106EA4C5|nr:glycosyltransferase-like domain-containing protein 1 isoform X4 [Perca flavescens]